MPRLLLALPLALAVAGCSFGPAYRSIATIEIAEEVGAEGLRQLVVDSDNGSVEVRCSPARDTVAITGEKQARGVDDASARTSVERIEVRVASSSDDPSRLEVTARTPDQHQGVRLVIDAPESLRLVLATRNGRLHATGAAAGVDARSSNGSVTVEGARGTVLARTSNGRISIRGTEGDVDAETSNGSVQLDDVHGESIRVVTSNGRLTLDDVGAHLDLESSNGSIQASLTDLPDAPRVRARTTNGSIRVEAPRDLDADVLLATSNGRVTVDLDPSVVREIEQSRERVRARLNDGGGSIDLATSNSSVHFRTRGDERSAIAPPPSPSSDGADDGDIDF